MVVETQTAPAFNVTAPINVLVPVFELKVIVPFIAEVPLTLRVTLPMVVPPAFEVKFPATLRMPVAVPVILPPLFIVNPPTPTLVVLPAVTQFAVPSIVRDRQLPAFPSIVTECPDAIVISSALVGIPTGSHVPGVFQGPLPLLTRATPIPLKEKETTNTAAKNDLKKVENPILKIVKIYTIKIQ